MQFIKKLNPANSLFGKIFIWFWITVVSMLLGAFFISSWINSTSTQVSAVGDTQNPRHTQFISKLNRHIDNGVPMHRAFKRMTANGRPLAIAVNSSTGQVHLSFPLPMLNKPMRDYRDFFKEMVGSEQVVVIKTHNMEFFGPYRLAGDADQYAIYLGRLLRRHERGQYSAFAGLSLMLVLGTGLCLFLAWRLSKPINQLRVTTQKIREGDFTYRMTNCDGRQDEVGALARDFNAMTERLTASLVQQQNLLANVSHELRTPLTRLQLSVAMLYEKLGDKDSDLQRIEKEVMQMDKLIGDVLSVTRMDLQSQGQLNIVFEPMCVKQFIERCMEGLNFEAEALGIDLRLTIESSATLDINFDSLKSAIENITRNALRYARSQVTIKISDEPNNTVLIVIGDDGPGLQGGAFENMIQAFYYVDKASASKHTSTGLGLTIANAAVKLNKGRLFEINNTEPDFALRGLHLAIELPNANESISRNQGE
ncbi:HAMP domain-containing protein [Agaribacter flavus]|uniref:histidine kinase n=1 Tax=Agaribacter flavus TaxID=1902781 RepID=A0ABV7FQG3_9ALTE